MHVTFRQLEIFEAVAHHLSISRAAAQLHLTQPAVSMQVKQLEQQVGLPLLEQLGKRLYLTPAGEEVRQHARRIAGQLGDLRSAMDTLRGLDRGRLHLAVVSTANYFVPKLLAEFGQRHPGVRVQLQVANRESVLAALADNRTDLAIIGQPPDSSEVVAQHFLDNPLVVIAPAGHALTCGEPVAPPTLVAQPLVVREPGSGTRAAMERHFAALGLVWHAGCELSSNEAIKQAVQAGLGLGVVSRQTIELEVETGRLAEVPVQGFPIMRRWYVVHHSGKRLSAATQAFRQLLLSQRPEEPVTRATRG
jgi:LysR family transcriptional regulator, low CO2-responsive transcriptional regulator